MFVVFAYPVQYFCRIDKATGRTVMNPYTPIAFK